MTSLTDLMEFSSIMYESGMTSLMEIRFHYIWQWCDKSHGDSWRFSSIMYGSGVTSLMEIQFHYV